MEQAAHRPVLVSDVLEALACRPGGVWVDGTIGAGGHAEAILRATAPDGLLLGFDRDDQALALARRRLLPFGERATLRHADHRDLPSILDELGVLGIDGILLDLGFSSLQVDDPERGFSFRGDGPLDMRMDRTQPTTAADLVNGLTERELRDLLARFGEEPQAARIAKGIARERERSPITRTGRLAEVIAAAAGGRRGARRSGRSAPAGGAIHPATRSFQALRIAVNDEIGYLAGLIEAAVARLRAGGRMAIISFHSLEDRAVKHTFRAMAHRCICPRGLPRCGCGRPDLVRLPAGAPVRPGPAEVRDNPRARSARLRWLERLETAA
jgi:16S rRNA (cytosine1402-N4)-methyltransferase